VQNHQVVDGVFDPDYMSFIAVCPICKIPERLRRRAVFGWLVRKPILILSRSCDHGFYCCVRAKKEDWPFMGRHFFPMLWKLLRGGDLN
jgi:hypothetical protein